MFVRFFCLDRNVLNSSWVRSSVTAMLYLMSCYTGLNYNGTRLYLIHGPYPSVMVLRYLTMNQLGLVFSLYELKWRTTTSILI